MRRPEKSYFVPNGLESTESRKSFKALRFSQLYICPLSEPLHVGPLG